MAEDSPTTMDKVTQDMDDLSFDPTMKKKKSSSRKKSVAFDDPTTADVAPEPSAATEQGTFLHWPSPFTLRIVLIPFLKMEMRKTSWQE